MRRCRNLTVVIVSIAVLSSCGSVPESDSSPTAVPDTLAAVPDTPAAAEAPTPTPTPQGEPAISVSDSPANSAIPADGHTATNRLPALQTVELDQPAIWPASDVVFATPEEAAADFVSEVLGVDPLLGEFMAGDSRSGEIVVLSPGDGPGAEPSERGLLAVRKIGPNDGWFVIAANSAGVSIGSPEALDEVTVGPLVVSGEGRGFEGTVVVTAFRAGDADDVLDRVITRGGVFATLEPYSVTLDLTGAAPGDNIAIIVRGDTGLSDDPGEFASLPIVVDSALPPTR